MVLRNYTGNVFRKKLILRIVEERKDRDDMVKLLSILGLEFINI